MILTKEEFKNQFGYNSITAVYRLISQKKIKKRDDDLIDTNDEANIEFCQKRQEKLLKNSTSKVEEKQPEAKTKASATKSADQLALEIDLLNAKLDEKRQKSALMNLKIAKERKEVIETEVLNRCIRAIFDDMIKSLTEFPNIYGSEIIRIVQGEEEPKEILVDFLTQKITSSIKMGLENAKIAAKKYYESE